MADVTISGLTQAPSVNTSDVLPISNGSTTYKASISQLLALQSGVPSGFIGMWSGAANAIPSGWFLCDGNNGTPNLVDRFVLGAGISSPAVGTIGGSKDAIVVDHTHAASSSVSDPGHSHTYVRATGNSGTGGRGTGGSATENTSSSQTGISVSTSIAATGSSGTNANMPPYYALCYIMKG